MTVQNGTSTSSTLTVTSLSRFSGTVSLAASNPSGTSATPNPSSLTISPGGSATSKLNISASPSAAGQYTVTVTGTSGSQTHSVNVTVGVTIPPPKGTQAIFHDDYSSSAGWTQVGAEITVNSQQFPGVVQYNQESGGGGSTEERVYKQLPSSLPSGNWVAEFNYKFTASNIPAAFIFTLTSDSTDPEKQPISNNVRVYHGPGADSLLIVGTGGWSPTIPISPNTQYYLRLQKMPTLLELNVFSDPHRTVQVPGSPVFLNIASTDYNNNLNFLQHDGCWSCGPTRTLTAQITNTTIYASQGTPPPTQVSVSVKSVDLSGNPITGLWTVVRTPSGTTVSSGFTPVSFTLTSGNQYVVHVGNYQNDIFNHWDDNSTSSYRTITPTQNLALTAYYSTGTTPPTSTAPSAPQNLQATGGNAQVSLSWTVPSNNGGATITNYKIYRSTSSGAETLLTTVGNVVSYTDGTVTNGQAYFYKVSAVNSVGESSQSNEASATPSVPPPTTTAVITVQAVDSSGTVLHMYTLLKNSAAVTITTGFTPVGFTINTNTDYLVKVSNYSTHIFQHWQDQPSNTNQVRPINISQNTTIVAVFS